MDLRVLRFPRSASKDEEVYTPSHMQWPPNLDALTLSGELTPFLNNDVTPLDGKLPNLPLKVTQLTIQHSSMSVRSAVALMARMGSQLSYLNVNSLSWSGSSIVDDPFGGWGSLLRHCPKLSTLVISADLADDTLLFAETGELNYWTLEHPLQHLYIAAHGRVICRDNRNQLGVHDIEAALHRGTLPKLRKLTFEKRFARPKNWDECKLSLHQLLKGRVIKDGGQVESAGLFFVSLT